MSHPVVAGSIPTHQMVRPMSVLDCVPEERCLPRFRTAAAGSPPACAKAALRTSSDGCRSRGSRCTQAPLHFTAAAHALASTCWAACQALAAWRRRPAWLPHRLYSCAYIARVLSFDRLPFVSIGKPALQHAMSATCCHTRNRLGTADCSSAFAGHVSRNRLISRFCTLHKGLT